MIVDIIIMLIIASGIGFCILLALRKDRTDDSQNSTDKQGHAKKKYPTIIDIIIALVLTAAMTLATAAIGEKFGSPSIAISNLLKPFGISVTPPTPEPTALSMPTPYTDPTFIPYESETYNYKIEYPSEFSPEHGVDNMDNDLHFSSEDRRSDLRVVARFIEGNELPYDYTIDNFKNTYGGTEIYTDDEMDSEGWYVTSRKTADQIYVYRKCIFTNGIVRRYTFSFPVEQEEKYLNQFNYVAYIEKSFRKLQ